MLHHLESLELVLLDGSFKTLKQSLLSKAQLKEFASCMQEYFELGHAELIPATELKKPHRGTYYMPVHTVWKESSTTTKVRVVFE